MASASTNGSFSSPRRRGRVVAWLVISQGFSLLSLLPWLVVAGIGMMAFDSGFSTESVLFVGAIWAYPLLPIGATITAWILFALKRDRAALIVTSLPLLLAVPLNGYIGYAWLSQFL